MPKPRSATLPSIRIPHRPHSSSAHAASADHVNEVHFAFLDGAPDTPSTLGPPRLVRTSSQTSTSSNLHLPLPLTPSLRAIRPALLDSSPTGATSPTSLIHLFRILTFLVLLGIIPSTFVFFIDVFVHSISVVREDTIDPKHGTPGILLYIASGLALCLASTFVCHVFSQEAEGSGIPAMKSLMSGFYDRQKPALSLWALLAKTLGLICAIGGGLPVGWEGPNVHISCIVAHHLSRLPPFRPLRRDRALRMQIMACACAVGLASSFGTPIGGVLYALETTASFYLVPTFWKCVLATLAGSLVYDLLYKTPLVQAFQNTTFPASTYKRDQLFAFAFLGALLGLLGAFFVRCVHSVYAVRKRRMLGSNRYVLLSAVGIITALLQYPHSLLRLDPRDAINQFFSADSMEGFTTANVIILILIKFPLMVVSVGLPVPAGVFIPCFLLGSGLGRLYGESLRTLFGTSVVPGGFAVVGAAAFTAGVTRALSVAVVIFEVTGQLEHMVPTLAAVLIAVIVGNGINRSLYDTLIIMKELPYMPHMRRDRAPIQRVHEIMRTNVVVLDEVSSLGRIRETLDKYTKFESFPIVADGGLFLGAVRRRTLIALLNRRIPIEIVDGSDLSMSSGGATGNGASQPNGSASSVPTITNTSLSTTTTTTTTTTNSNSNHNDNPNDNPEPQPQSKSQSQSQSQPQSQSQLATQRTASPPLPSSPPPSSRAPDYYSNGDLGELIHFDNSNPHSQPDSDSHPHSHPHRPHVFSSVPAVNVDDDDDDDDANDAGEAPSGGSDSRGGSTGLYGEDTNVRLEPDLSPLVVTQNTLLSQLHFMFVMLMPTHSYVLTSGILQGIVTRGDLVQGGEIHPPRIRRRRGQSSRPPPPPPPPPPPR